LRDYTLFYFGVGFIALIGLMACIMLNEYSLIIIIPLMLSISISFTAGILQPFLEIENYNNDIQNPSDLIRRKN